MKTLTIVIGLVIILGVGALWLHAAPAARSPQLAETPPAPVPSVQASSSVSAPSQSGPSSSRMVVMSVAPAASHMVGTLTATPTLIVAGTSTQVSVSIQITDPALIPNGVNLVQLGADGTQPTIFGIMQDSGNNTYTFQPVFNNQTPGQVQFQASAAFKGALQRVLSNVVTFNVWNNLSDVTGGFTVLYPPSLYNLTDSNAPSGDYDLESSPTGVAIGGAVPEGSPVARSGYAISISYAAYTPSTTFDINKYLLNTFGALAGDATSTAVLIGGIPGYEITFQNEEGGSKPLAIVYHNGFVYQLKYSSTDYIVGFSDQDGLNDFNSLLQHFTFSH
jgi:hypothetical protein